MSDSINQTTTRDADIREDPLGAYQLVSEPELARLFSCSIATIRRRRKQGGDWPKPVRLGGRLIRYRAGDIAKHLESNC